jgi:hypothetical protein
LAALTRIETVELGLPALDALDVDALAVFIGPERPLQDLAGYADWRLCGLLSRAIRDGGYRPENGEALLLPSGGRIAVPRIFCFGLAARPRDEASFSAQSRRVCQAMYKARSTSWATAWPFPPPGVALPEAWLFLQAVATVLPRRLVLLGEARAMHRDLTAAREALGADSIEIVPLVSRVDMPARTSALPHSGAVVR